MNDHTATSPPAALCSIPAGPFICGGCGVAMASICILHAHMTNKHSDGSFHYDNLIKTAFPKYDSICAASQTQTMYKKYMRIYQSRSNRNPPQTLDKCAMDVEVRGNRIYLNTEPEVKKKKHLPLETAIAKRTLKGKKKNIKCITSHSYELQNNRRITRSCAQNRAVINGTVATDSKLSPVVKQHRIPHSNKDHWETEFEDKSSELRDKTEIMNFKNEKSTDEYQENVHFSSDMEDNENNFAEDAKPIVGDPWTDNGSLAITTSGPDTSGQAISLGRSIEEISLSDNEDIKVRAAEMSITNHAKRKKDKKHNPYNNPLSDTNKQVSKTMAGNQPIVKEYGHIAVKKYSKKTLENLDTRRRLRKKQQKSKRKQRKEVTSGVPEKKEKTKSFICHICGLVLKVTHDNIEGHMNAHLGLKPYICDICAMTFSNRNKLNRHLQQHGAKYSNSKYICKECGRCFPCRPEYMAHVNKHSGTKPYKCEHCGRKFATQKYVNQHIYRTHTPRNVNCYICGKVYHKFSSRDNHMVSCHKDPVFECQFCKKRFHLKKTWKHHVLTHTGNKQYFCSVCNHGFIQWTPCLRHMVKQHGLSREKVLEMKELKQLSKPDPQQQVPVTDGETSLTL